MQTFKKIILSLISVLVVISVVSSVLFYFSRGYDDPSKIESCEIPKDTNYIFCGASQTEMSFIPEIIDSGLGVNSFNLSSSALNMQDRFELCKKIIEQFNIETLVLEISSNALDFPESVESSFYAYQIFGNYLGKDYYFKYLLTNYKYHLAVLDTIQSNYNFRMNTGFSVLLNTVTGKNTDKEVKDNSYSKNLNSGYKKYDSVDISLDENEVINEYEKTKYDFICNENRLQSLNSIIELCKKNDIKVIITVVPVSDASIWENTSFSEFYNYVKTYCVKNNCKFYDFNLLKSRYDIFSDTYSYLNSEHMSYDGAVAFSDAYCEVINKVNSGEDVSDLFYKSYEEMKADSPYWAYMSK